MTADAVVATSRVKREVVQQVLQQIYDSEGELTDRRVVEVAADPVHPLHHFIWTKTDTEAAYEYRLAQARQLIRSVTITFTTTRGEQDQVVESRRWVSMVRAGVPDARGQYETAERVMADPVLQAGLMRSMRREISALISRYEVMPEFWQALSEALASRPQEEQRRGRRGRKAG